MATSLFLAQAFSLYFLIFGVAMLLRPAHFRKATIEMTHHHGIALLTSIFTLVLGIILVLFHNVWVSDWRVIITILAWLTLLKGTLRLLFPINAQEMMTVINNKIFYYSSLVFIILLGAYLAYIGFHL